MLNFIRSKIKIIRIAIPLFLVIVASGFIYIKTQAVYLLSPGPLSAFNSKAEELGGVMSHADLERDCKHCHAPIHCITDSRCQDCHLEIAEDRNDVNTLHGRLPGVSRCQNCHTEHNGADADLIQLSFPNVDHYMLSGFSLSLHIENYDGTVFTCTTCHTKAGNFLETLDCISCHSKEDHDYMAAHIEEYGSACVDCHDGSDRMIAGFDHEPYYPLQDGHENLECAQCHQDQKYVGISSTCVDCHADPELHAGVFGENCNMCHSVAAWAPAELKEHTFMIQHGDEPIDTCETCHAGSYTEYPCGTCHENAEMETMHLSEGITEINDCISCHPTGRGKEEVFKPDTQPAITDNSNYQNNTTQTNTQNQTLNEDEKKSNKPNKDSNNKSGKDG